jgi:hypothetical protein
MLGNSTDESTKMTDDDNTSVQASIKVGYTAPKPSGGDTGGDTGGDKGNAGGADITVGSSSTWDSSTTHGYGDASTSSEQETSSVAFGIQYAMPADPLLVPGSAATCASATDCTHLVQPSNAYQQEPFWQDQFVLLVHPQFAAWVLGNGASRYVMYAAVPVLVHTSVLDLAACAQRITIVGGIDPCRLDYSDSVVTTGPGGSVRYAGKAHSVTLTPADARNLLQLDPFYGAGQNAALDTHRAAYIASAAYGGRAGDLPRPYTENVTNQQQTQDTSTTQTYYTANVTDIIGNAESAGASINLGFLNETLGVTDGEKSIEQTDMKVTYSASTVQAQTTATMASGTLNDVDNSVPGAGGGAQCKACHGPLPVQPSVNIFLDRQFGGFMYQDPNTPAPSLRERSAVNLAQMLLQELRRQE